MSQDNLKEQPYFIVWDLNPQEGLIEFSFTIGSKPICNQNYINLEIGELTFLKWSK